MEDTQSETVASVDRSLETLRRWTLGTLIAMEGALALLHAGFTWAPAGTYPEAIVDLVHMDREANLPTWFSASQLGLLGLAFLTVWILDGRGRPRARGRPVWLILAAGTWYLSADEAASLHETFGTLLGTAAEGAPPGSLLHTLTRFPSYYWLLIYVPLALPLGIVAGRFLWRELGQARTTAMAGLSVYFLGAVVLDYLEGRYGDEHHGHLGVGLLGQVFRFDVFLVEELLEMAGVTLLLAAVLRQAIRHALPGKKE